MVSIRAVFSILAPEPPNKILKTGSTGHLYGKKVLGERRRPVFESGPKKAIRGALALPDHIEVVDRA